jgi:lipoprotein-anchoring transpeptidase ErfK/SrfK
VSTGSGERFCVGGACSIADTPAGSYRFTWRYPGWRESRLGKLYNPVYFNGGIAVHGEPWVGATPVSHGCVRIPMLVADYFPTLVKTGDPIIVFNGGHASVVKV